MNSWGGFGDLQDPESCANHKFPKFIQESFHLNLPSRREVLKSIGVFGEVAALQAVDYRFWSENRIEKWKTEYSWGLDGTGLTFRFLVVILNTEAGTD